MKTTDLNPSFDLITDLQSKVHALRLNSPSGVTSDDIRRIREVEDLLIDAHDLLMQCVPVEELPT